MSIVSHVKDLLTSKGKAELVISDKKLLSTGSTLLNLACSGRPSGGFPRGKYIFVVGDSASGKTFAVLTCLAEATINKSFRQFRLIYDNAEDGALMDLEKFFGKAVKERVEPPALEDGTPVYSTTVEEFYYHVDDATKDGRPFIYILDSMDSITAEAEETKFEEQKTAFRKGKQAAGSYGADKAKQNSAKLRKIISFLKREGKSILIIISQTRDNLGFGFEKKTRSGGHALRFYATLEMWLSIKNKIRRKVKGKDRQLGIVSQIQIKKNRLTGKERTIEIPIYWSSGMDDVGSMVDYLVEEGHWTKGKSGTIHAKDFNMFSHKEALIKLIEDDYLETELKSIVTEVWNNIEEACEVNRKRKYQ